MLTSHQGRRVFSCTLFGWWTWDITGRVWLTKVDWGLFKLVTPLPFFFMEVMTEFPILEEIFIATFNCLSVTFMMFVCTEGEN